MNRLMLVPLSICWIHVAHIAHAASPTIADYTYVAEAIARNAVIWDVRTADAYAAGHIAGAVNIGDAPRVLPCSLQPAVVFLPEGSVAKSHPTRGDRERGIVGQ